MTETGYVLKAHHPVGYRRITLGRVLTVGAIGGLAWAAFAFLTLPIVGLLVRAVRADAWTGLSTGAVTSAIQLSAITSLLALALIVLFGTPLAYVLAQRQFPFKRVVNTAIELPIVLPPAVAGLALLSAFGQRGLLGPVLSGVGLEIGFTLLAVILAQAFVAGPFYVRAAVVGFASIPDDVIDAARVDGADESALFWYVMLPMAGRGLGAGLVLSWARALGEFGATLMFAGSLSGITQTMPLLIYETFQTDIDAAITAGVLLVGVAMAALFISGWLTGREDSTGL
jgi:molybdate transport system permease protein